MRDILFLAHRVPFPPNRGDKIRSFHILKHLARHARVHLLAFGDTAADQHPPSGFRELLASCTIVQRDKSRARAVVEALAADKPISLTAFADRRMARAVGAHRGMPTYVFSGQMAQYVDAPEVMDFVDVDSAKFAAFAAASRGPMRWLMRREARLLGRYEQQVAARSGTPVFVSAAEAALFGGPRTIAVENGIDTRHFDPAAAFARLADARAPLIVFTGQMDYRPNVDAVDGFVRTALPAVRLRHPAARFAIVGRAPTAAVRALAAEPGVVVTGEVDDVRPWLAAADVCVAPLALARGIQNKVLEAMAMARPVVASVAAAEGIDHAGTIRVSDDSVADVCGVLEDRVTAEMLGQGARAQVVRRYAWDARLAGLDTLFDFGRSEAE